MGFGFGVGSGVGLGLRLGLGLGLGLELGLGLGLGLGRGYLQDGAHLRVAQDSLDLRVGHRALLALGVGLAALVGLLDLHHDVL